MTKSTEKAKLTKKQMVEKIAWMSTLLKPETNAKDKSLKEMADYNVTAYANNPTKVTAEDLRTVGTEIQEHLKATKRDTSKGETAKKSTAKKPVVEKEVVTKKKPTAEDKSIVKLLGVDQNISFAPKFTLTKLVDDHVVELELVKNINNLGDLLEAKSAERDIKMCVYWSKKLLAQFPYDTTGTLREKIVSFECDVDVLKPVLFTSNILSCYFVSELTEVMFVLQTEDLEEIDGVRYMNGTEYQLYEVVKKTPISEIKEAGNVVKELMKEVKKPVEEKTEEEEPVKEEKPVETKKMVAKKAPVAKQEKIQPIVEELEELGMIEKTEEKPVEETPVKKGSIKSKKPITK